MSAYYALLLCGFSAIALVLTLVLVGQNKFVPLEAILFVAVFVRPMT